MSDWNETPPPRNSLADLTPSQIKSLRERSARERKQVRIPPLVPQERGDSLPLSYAQERLWFLDRLGLAGVAYNSPQSFRLLGILNVEALERSFRELLRRHESLRTHFRPTESGPIQIIDPPGLFPLQRWDFSELGEQDQGRELQRVSSEEARRPFDLSKGPLVRASLVKLSPREHVLLLTMHHIVTDGWSIGILNRELGTLYGSYCEGRPPPLAELPVQYADYAMWQRQWLQGDTLKDQLRYWKKQLDGAPPQLQLPTDRSRPPVPSFNGRLVSFELPASSHSALQELARSEGATLFMVMLAAYQILLSRYSGQQDVVVGSGIAGRTHAHTQGLIGFFVNTLSLRVDLSGNPRFRELLKRVREVTLGAYEHQDVPFELLVKELRPQRNLSHQPIFQVALMLQNFPREQTELAGLTWTPIDIEHTRSVFDLTLFLIESPGGLRGVFEYATDLFDESTVGRMAVQLQALLQGILADPDCPIEQLPMMSLAERREVLRRFSGTAVSYPESKLVHQLFEERVQRAPDAVAVVYEGQSLTYAQLNAKANQLAWYLRERGVGPDQLVGICVERGLEMVVGLLGILKAGGAYVPLDPGYPAERLEYMLEDAAPKVLLTQQRLRERVSTGIAEVIALDGDSEQIADRPVSNLRVSIVGVHSGHLAYVIYTSGSVGRPKGVMVEHRNLARLFAASERWYGFDERDVWTLFHSFAFDFSVWELWGALLYGGRLVVVPHLTARSPQHFYRLICAEGVTVLNQTPSAFAQLISAQEQALRHSLRVVIFGGEALELRSLRPWVKCNGATTPQLVNMYGITETTVHVTYGPLTQEDISSERGGLIGRPIDDLKVYLLDAYREPVPIGVKGEIYIGGAGVARGYLNRPELTAERFVKDPFSAEPGARMYRSGDLGRWQEDGTIEYLGRNDEQVKIRGFRIELGEIEAQLLRHEQVKGAVVVAREDTPGEKRLVGYVVMGSEEAIADVEGLRGHLKAVLPEYMVPAAIVRLERLPLTPNGKLDRRALPAPELGAYASRQYEAPQGEVEQILAGIWQELLKVERIGRHDNFFELGGHSLLATQLIARLRSSLSIDVPMRLLFKFPVMKDFAAQVQHLRHESSIHGAAAGGPDIGELFKRVASMPENEVQELLHALRTGATP